MRTDIFIDESNEKVHSFFLFLIQRQHGILVGHGANGISMSWGTSIHAAKLVKNMLANSNSRL
jgi:hypothetical protein